MNFTAIDFETATYKRNSACAVAIVTVESSKIVDEYYTLIRPPGNIYRLDFSELHGIYPADTENAPLLSDIYPEIRKRMKGKTIVAHNESFDRGVLKSTMEYYDLDYSELDLNEKWECTMWMYRRKGYGGAGLRYCCDELGIELDHHNALSDTLACAKLYLMK